MPPQHQLQSLLSLRPRLPNDMKKLTSLLLAAVILCGLIPLVPSCSTANTVAYKSVTTTQVTVEAAMTGWGDWIQDQAIKGTPVPMEQRAKVKAAYERYQAAAVLVTDAGMGYTRANGTTNAPTAQAALNVAIQVAGASLSDLVNLIRSFGIKL